MCTLATFGFRNASQDVRAEEFSTAQATGKTGLWERGKRKEDYHFFLFSPQRSESFFCKDMVGCR